MLLKTLFIVGTNNLIMFPLLIYLSALLKNGQIDHSFAVEDLPDWKKLGATITFSIMIGDLGTYLSHKFFHWPPIYPCVHKLHHDYMTTILAVSEYTHPIEFMFGSVIPGSLSSMILGPHMHIYSLWVWTVVRVTESNEAHCGYELPFSPYRLIPFSAPASYHDYHHSHNIGNYSTQLVFWDVVFGDNKAYY